MAALAAALPAVTAADPCDTLPPDVNYTPPPYTVAALQAALSPGLTTILEVQSPVAGRFYRRARVLSIDEEGLTMVEEGAGPTPPPLGTRREHRLTWEALRDYGCFPTASASRRRTSVQTDFGDLAGWEYEILGEAGREVLFFADELPALPMRAVRYEQSMRAVRIQQVWRSDRADPVEAQLPDVEAGGATPPPVVPGSVRLIPGTSAAGAPLPRANAQAGE